MGGGRFDTAKFLKIKIFYIPVTTPLVATRPTSTQEQT